MADLFDYLDWRGDLTFTQDPPNEVDALIFASLAYLDYSSRVSRTPDSPVPLRDAAEEFLALADQEGRYRVKNDLKLLEAAAESRRFGFCRVLFYRNVLDHEEETQFAAVSYLLDDGSAFLAFRGTDYSLAGWKEDFNMSFRDEVPSQRLALEYFRDFAEAYLIPVRMGGHSKGGNLAVFAAANAGTLLQQRILTVYNLDGPGFRENMIQRSGYLDIVPKIQTYIPQSSVIGMLLEHEEPFKVVRSKQIGLLQHETYSWDIMAKSFIPMEGITQDSRLLDQTLKTWLADMTLEERNDFVDSLFSFLSTGEITSAKEMIQPKNILNYLRAWRQDDKLRHTLTSEMFSLISTAYKLQFQKLEE
jgi:hypothetical protein